MSEGATGVLFEEQTVNSLNAAIQKFEKTTFHTDVIRAHAEKFSKQQFQDNLLAYISAYQTP